VTHELLLLFTATLSLSLSQSSLYVVVQHSSRDRSIVLLSLKCRGENKRRKQAGKLGNIATRGDKIFGSPC